jgi:hypothetical protein
MDRPQMPGGTADPIGKRRTVEIDPLTLVELRLAIKWQVVGVFGNQNLGDGCLGRMPPSISRAGAAAWTTTSSQAWQAYFGRRTTRTRNCAGTMSSFSPTSSPIRCRSLRQQGQAWSSISTTISMRSR